MALRTVPVEQPRLRAICAAQAMGAGQQDLAATDGKGLAGPEPRLGLLSLGPCEATNKERWFHTPLFLPFRVLKECSTWNL